MALLAGTIMAEMVVVVAAGEEPPKSSKGVVMRGVVEEMFKGVIDGAYKRFEDGAGEGGRAGKSGADVVGEAVWDVVGPLGEDEDLFAAGVDSVMAALIRGRLVKVRVRSRAGSRADSRAGGRMLTRTGPADRDDSAAERRLRAADHQRVTETPHPNISAP